MDPLSHVSLGRTLVGVLGPRDAGGPRSGAIAAAVLGALAPDIDSVLMPFGWDRYLRFHEIGLHTIVGTVVCGLLTAGVVRVFARSSYRGLVFCAWLGAVSHVLLDLLSSARLRPGWPIVDTVVSLPVVAMADPWLLSLCVAGAVTFWLGRSGRSTRIALAATVAFVLAKASAGAVAFSGYQTARDRAGEPVQARAIEAEWASLTRWRVLDRTPERLRVWNAETGKEAALLFAWPLPEESDAIRSSRSLSTVRNFLRAHQLGFAAALPQDDGRTLVLWSDIRFCWDPGVRGSLQLDPIVASPVAGRIACALWFGGEFDAAGRAVREIVKVGGFTQSR
jgi:membrane-bound metal-dependent hydrolase YbcI (DUF457 family)